jgi:hypothetical protein
MPVGQVGVGITAVVDVAVGKAKQNDLSIGIIAVVRPFAESLPDWRLGRDFAGHIDPPYALPRGKRPEGKEPQALDQRGPHVHIFKRRGDHGRGLASHQ